MRRVLANQPGRPAGGPRPTVQAIATAHCPTRVARPADVRLAATIGVALPGWTHGLQPLVVRRMSAR